MSSDGKYDVSIIFIEAAMGSDLALRAELERTTPAKLAGEFVAAHINDELEDFLIEGPLGASVSQHIKLSEMTAAVLEDAVKQTGERRVDLIRACMRKGLSLPVSKFHLN